MSGCSPMQAPNSPGSPASPCSPGTPGRSERPGQRNLRRRCIAFFALVLAWGLTSVVSSMGKVMGISELRLLTPACTNKVLVLGIGLRASEGKAVAQLLAAYPRRGDFDGLVHSAFATDEARVLDPAAFSDPLAELFPKNATVAPLADALTDAFAQAPCGVFADLDGAALWLLPALVKRLKQAGAFRGPGAAPVVAVGVVDCVFDYVDRCAAAGPAVDPAGTGAYRAGVSLANAREYAVLSREAQCGLEWGARWQQWQSLEQLFGLRVARLPGVAVAGYGFRSPEVLIGAGLQVSAAVPGWGQKRDALPTYAPSMEWEMVRNGLGVALVETMGVCGVAHSFNYFSQPEGAQRGVLVPRGAGGAYLPPWYFPRNATKRLIDPSNRYGGQLPLPAVTPRHWDAERLKLAGRVSMPYGVNLPLPNCLNAFLLPLISGKAPQKPNKAPFACAAGMAASAACQVLWGAGVDGGDPIDASAPDKFVAAVQGPRAAQLVTPGAERSGVAHGDPGLLVGILFGAGDSEGDRTHDLCIIPTPADEADPAVAAAVADAAAGATDGVSVAFLTLQTCDLHGYIRSLQRCKAVASSALHGLIFAASFGIPHVHLLLNDGRGTEEATRPFRDFYEGALWVDGYQSLGLDNAGRVQYRALVDMAQGNPVPPLPAQVVWDNCPFHALFHDRTLDDQRNAAKKFLIKKLPFRPYAKSVSKLPL
eukprot:TRINITY_DN3647_c0_g1_i1.p1 TRINITY_DN3647_c0_g1~~TRINITY_DN3647_c0_g1_i1.p1  ORF type:complete len:707 (+),score=138.08 TRINITY_DN3647_c0_g1_i1:1196-3316(+)